MNDWEDVMSGVAATCDGLVANFHLAERFDAREHIRSRALRTGRWVTHTGRLLRSVSAPETTAQRIRAAVLDPGPGTILFGPSTLAWSGIDGYQLADLHVARVRGVGAATSDLATMHHLRALRAHHVVVVDGIVTQTVLRAIWCEAARYASPRWVEIGLLRIGNLLDQAHKKGLVTWTALHEMVDDISQRGRAGTRIMRELAAGRLPGTSPTESRNEKRLEEILDGAGVRPLRRQVHVGGHEPIGRTDFRDDLLPLVTEVNSLLHHTTPSDQAADERRYQALLDAGFMVLVIWDDDLWRHPQTIVAMVAQSRRWAAQGRRVVMHSPSCPWPFPRVGDPDGRS